MPGEVVVQRGPGGADLDVAIEGPDQNISIPTEDPQNILGFTTIVNRSGSVLDDITLLSNYRNPTGNIGVEIQGLTLAPSSDPNDDPAKLNLYVADAGLLNGPNDGRLIEIDLHSGLLFA